MGDVCNMITSAKYINYIVETLNVLRQEIISMTQLNLLDGNVHAENFIGDLINMCYGYKLSNLNEDKSNFPGIDLGDKKLGIGVQVTSTKTSTKINDTLIKCCKHKCYKIYPRLKIFILTEKQGSYSISCEYKDKINFDIEKDILDFDSLYIKAMNLGVTKQKEIADYINQQVPIVSEFLGIDFYCPSAYKRLQKKIEESDWVESHEGRYVISIEHNFGYIPQHSIFDDDGRLIICDVRADEKIFTIEAMSKFRGIVVLS
jgi:hypothetical protein